MGSLFNKIKSMSKNGITPVIEGRENYKYNNKQIELATVDRKNICINCDNYKDEPIDFFQVEDKRIKELDKKMCDECGCALPYLLRQNIKICKKW